VTARRGFTLVELLIALVMMVLVAGGIYSLMVTTNRVSRKQTEISNLQGNLRGGLNLVQSELQEIYTDAAVGLSDISVMTATSLQYDAMRGIGEICGVTLGGGAVQIRQDGYSGRPPVPGRDRLKLFQDRDTLLSSDDVWLDRAIGGINPNGVCTVGALGPSWDLLVPGLLADDLIDAVSGNPLLFAPGPVRTVEQMELGLVNDAGKDWLGIRSSSGGEATLIPVIGPLTASGLEFKYYDGGYGETLAPSAVKTIVVKLRGVSAQQVTTGLGSTLGSPEDSVLVRVQLRNSR
jgi:prepilin-type N-terminal cleavage/methylation domain-containing protein